jgi:hypothetical protein
MSFDGRLLAGITVLAAVVQGRSFVRAGVLIGMGSRRRSASQAIDLPSDRGVNFERLFTCCEQKPGDGRYDIGQPH